MISDDIAPRVPVAQQHSRGQSEVTPCRLLPLWHPDRHSCRQRGGSTTPVAWAAGPPNTYTLSPKSLVEVAVGMLHGQRRRMHSAVATLWTEQGKPSASPICYSKQNSAREDGVLTGIAFLPDAWRLWMEHFERLDRGRVIRLRHHEQYNAWCSHQLTIGHSIRPGRVPQAPSAFLTGRQCPRRTGLRAF